MFNKRKEGWLIPPKKRDNRGAEEGGFGPQKKKNKRYNSRTTHARKVGKTEWKSESGEEFKNQEGSPNGGYLMSGKMGKNGETTPKESDPPYAWYNGPKVSKTRQGKNKTAGPETGKWWYILTNLPQAEDSARAGAGGVTGHVPRERSWTGTTDFDKGETDFSLGVSGRHA